MTMMWLVTVRSCSAQAQTGQDRGAFQTMALKMISITTSRTKTPHCTPKGLPEV
ncbi:hypothetical protein D3C87_2014040 [compost metagenome]